MTDSNLARTRWRVGAWCAASALVVLVIGVDQDGACGANQAPRGHEALRKSHEPAPATTRSDEAALLAVPDRSNAGSDGSSLDGVTAPPVRVALASGVALAQHADLARLDIVARADGESVAGALVGLRGIGAAVPAPGTNVDEAGRPLTDERGRASVFVRPMVTWHGEVVMLEPRRVGEFVATSPRAGGARTLEVSLTPNTGSRFIHAVVVSLPSGAPFGGAALRCETHQGAELNTLDGTTAGITGVDGRVVLCWPERATLRIEAKGHTLRKLTWRDAQRPVSQLAYASKELAETHAPIEIELAALGAVFGESLPAWIGAGRVFLDTSLQVDGFEFGRSQVGARPDELGQWRIDGIPTWVGEGSARAFRAGVRVPIFGLALHADSVGKGILLQPVPIASNVALRPGEARRIEAPWGDSVVELGARVTVDGVLAEVGTRLQIVLRPAPAEEDDGLATRVAPAGAGSSGARSGQMRAELRLDRLRFHLTVDEHGHVRAAGLPPGTYDVSGGPPLEVGRDTATIQDFELENYVIVTPRPSFSGTLVLPWSAGASRFTGELALQRID